MFRVCLKYLNSIIMFWFLLVSLSFDHPGLDTSKIEPHLPNVLFLTH
jgi:hypothetical protein